MMGRSARLNHAAGLPRLLATRLYGLRVAVDVQHLYKPPPSDRDRGAVFTLADGLTIYEAQLATLYAQGLVMWLHQRGAVVLCNDPAHGSMVGSYGRRNLEAFKWGAHAYLACHVNAGKGGYCLNEYPAGTPGAALAVAIGTALDDEFAEILEHREAALTSVQRGFVCIKEFDRSRPAVIVEPFFGDNAKHQALIPAPALVRVGEAIGEGLAAWWERFRT